MNGREGWGGALGEEADWAAVVEVVVVMLGGLQWFNATVEAAVKGGLPFFPRPVRRTSPASACQGQVTFLIYTQGLWTRTMQTHSSFGLCMHTGRHTLVCTQRVDGVSDRDRGWGGGDYSGSDFCHLRAFFSELDINKEQQNSPKLDVFMSRYTVKLCNAGKMPDLNPQCNSLSQKPCHTVSNNQQGSL